MRKYDSYKDTGIEWLGQIPAHWGVSVLKHVTTLINRGNSPEYVDDSDFYVLNQSCIQWDFIDEAKKKYNKICNLSELKGKLQQLDLVINSTGTGTLGRVNIFNLEGKWFADSHVTVVRFDFKKYVPKLAKYILSTECFQGYIYSTMVSGSTNQIELGSERLKSLPIYVPPLSEQQQIADYLDQQTAKIDKLVRKQNKLIEALQEKKKSLINHVVTKGLNPNEQMKDSGIEWLGQIPAHWGVKKLKDICIYIKGYAFKSNDFVDSGVPIVKATDIKEYKITEPNSFINSVINDDYKKVILKNNDIVISTVGSQPDVVDSAVGQLALIDEKTVGAYLNQNAVILRTINKTIDVKYIYYNFISKYFREHLNIIARGTANQSNIRISDILGYFLSMPPLQEQQQIADYLDQQTAKIDELINKAKSMVELLKEHKQSLINNVVTGKIKVF